MDIKQRFTNLSFSFHIDKLAKEFDDSHREVNLQPVKNRQITL